MSEPFLKDGDFTVPVAVSPIRRAPAFAGEKAFYILEQDFFQYFEDFAPLNLHTEHPLETGYFLVEETPLQDVGNGLAKWTRRYSAVPAAHTIFESHAFTFPGLTPGGIYTPKTLEPNGTLASGEHTLTTLAAHGYSVNDEVFIRVASPYLVDDVASSIFSVFYQAFRVITAVPSSTTFKVAALPGTQPQFIYVVKASTGRKPLTKTVMSKIVFDYHVVEAPEDVDLITILKPTEIIDGGGLITDTYGFETFPSQATYIGDVGEWIVAENSVVRPWLGRIYERATRYVIAE
jgi:hypothetical protein